MLKPRVFALILLLVVLNLPLTGIALAQDVHWSYSGESGPEHWAELSPDYALCASGLEQSPVEIALSSPTNVTGLQFNYEPSALNIFNNGHTIQANYDSGSTVEIDGIAYALSQFHFHNPSEHTVDGTTTPMELHLVHANSDGGLAVVGIFLVEGAENAALAPVFDNLPAEEGEPLTIDGATINATAFLPSEHTYWRYDGSLTTPACGEGVKWHVMQRPVELSAEQIAAFSAIVNGNARPVQPWNEREYLLVSPLAALPGAEATATPMADPAAMPVTGASDNPLIIMVVVASVVIALGALSGFSHYRKRTLQG